MWRAGRYFRRLKQVGVGLGDFQITSQFEVLAGSTECPECPGCGFPV